MLNLNNACKSLSVPQNKDSCFSSSLVYYDEIETRSEMETKLANNEHACKKCYNYLTSFEQSICDID
jgi:hypothetical protein